MSFLKKDLLNYQDKLYWIYRQIRASQVKPEFISDIKEFWMCDIVLKNRNNNEEILLFLREIPEAVVIN